MSDEEEFHAGRPSLPLIDKSECYYCRKPLTVKYRSMNKFGNMDFAVWTAIVEEQGKDVRRPVHNECMTEEEETIIATDDWARGERFQRTHSQTNPMARAKYEAPCGCTFDLLRKAAGGPYSFSGMERDWCEEHQKIRDSKDPLLFYRFVAEQLKTQDQFVIEDHYLDERVADGERKRAEDAAHPPIDTPQTRTMRALYRVKDRLLMKKIDSNKKYPEQFDRIVQAVQLLRPLSETEVHFDRWNYKKTYIEVHIADKKEWDWFVTTFHPRLDRMDVDEVTYRGTFPVYYYSAHTEVCGIEVSGYSPHFKAKSQDEPLKNKDDEDAEAKYMILKTFGAVANGMAEEQRLRDIKAEELK